MKTGNFDRVAWYYDFLGTLVFGNSREKAQRYLLSFLPPEGKILVVGGGSGWILEAVAGCRRDLEIVYVEASAEMLERARKRNWQGNNVIFIHGLAENYNRPPATFDGILTPFLFDLFTNEMALLMYRHLLCMLKPGGRWFYTDFTVKRGSPGWQRLLLRSMYLFFRVTTGLKTSKLPDFEELGNHELAQAAAATFYGGFIEAAVYVKTDYPVNTYES